MPWSCESLSEDMMCVCVLTLGCGAQWPSPSMGTWSTRGQQEQRPGSGAAQGLWVSSLCWALMNPPLPPQPCQRLTRMKGTANVHSTGRSHYQSAIPVPRAMAHSKLHSTAPLSTPGSPVLHRAPSPRPGKVPAPAPKTLKPKATGKAAEPAEGREGSLSVPAQGGQREPSRALVSPGKWPEAVGSGRRGAGRVGEPPELCKASLAQGRGGGQLGGSTGKGRTATSGTGDESHGGSQGRGPVFGSGAITFSSGPPHSHPVTATVAPFQYR